MKYKFLVPILCSIILGLFFGKVFFDSYDANSLTVFDEAERVYMLQIGVYSTCDKNKFSNFLCISSDDGYHVYVGITKSKDIASRIKKFYEKDGYDVYIKEEVISNESFLSILGEYDKIIDITNDEDCLSIEKIIISNYKEMVLEGED